METACSLFHDVPHEQQFYQRCHQRLSYLEKITLEKVVATAKRIILPN
jgi:hypothetical protein